MEGSHLLLHREGLYTVPEHRLSTAPIQQSHHIHDTQAIFHLWRHFGHHDAHCINIPFVFFEMLFYATPPRGCREKIALKLGKLR
jgi:hypothetical protein